MAKKSKSKTQSKGQSSKPRTTAAAPKGQTSAGQTSMGQATMGHASTGQAVNRHASMQTPTAIDQDARLAWGRWDGAFLAAAILGPFLLYLPTLSSAVLLEDDGFLIGVGHNLGVAHPPGYPLYTLLLWAFMKLPFFATPALAGHTFSAVLSALGCGVLYGCGRLLGLGTMAAVLAAWMFGIQEHVWSQSIRAEVYSLNFLLIFSALALCLLIRQAPNRRTYWVLGGVIVGLGMASHWPLFVLAGLGFAVLLAPVWRSLGRHGILAVACALLIASALYGWMVWRSLADPNFGFSGPIEGWGEFRSYFLREQFRGVDDSPSAGWWDRTQFMMWFCLENIKAFTWVGFVATAFGLYSLWRRQWFVTMALIILWFSQGGVLIALLNFDFDGFYIDVFRVYSLAAYGVLAIFFALGIAELTKLAAAYVPQIRRHRGLAPLCFILAGSPFFGVTAFQNFSKNNPSDSSLAKNYAAYVFEKLPNEAILIIGGDFHTTVLGYYRYIEPMRTNVDLFQSLGLVYNQRLYPADSSQQEARDTIAELVSTSPKPVYFASIATAKSVCPSCQINTDGLLIRASIPEAEPSSSWGNIDQEFILNLIEHEPKDAWAKDLQSLILQEFGVSATSILSEGGESVAQVEQIFRNPDAAPWVQLGAVLQILKFWSPVSLPTTIQWMQEAEERFDKIAFRKSYLAQFYRQKGQLYLVQNEPGEALIWLRKSVEVWDHPHNSAEKYIEEIQSQLD